MRLSFRFVLLGFLLVLSGCYSRSESWKVGPIPGGESFLVLSPMEHRRDSITERHHQEHLARLADGSALIVKYPDSVLRKFVQEEKNEHRPLRDNRARFRNRSERNGKPDPEGMFRDTAMWETECSCVLTENGIARLQAGMWVFGGFQMELELDRSGGIRSRFWEDQHERPVFKRTLADSSLDDDVLVANSVQELLLAKPPRFSPGESVRGRLEFRTAPYFRSSEFQSSFSKEGGYSDATMDIVRTAGTMDFLCQVKACAPADSATRWNRANNPKWSNDPCR